MFAVQRLAEAGLDDELAELLRRHVVARAAVEAPAPGLALDVVGRAEPRRPRQRPARVRGQPRPRRPRRRRRHRARHQHAVAQRVAELAPPVSYAEGRQWVDALLSRDLADADRSVDAVISRRRRAGSGDPLEMRAAPPRPAALSTARSTPRRRRWSPSIYDAMVHLVDARARRRSAWRLRRATGHASGRARPGPAGPRLPARGGPRWRGRREGLSRRGARTSSERRSGRARLRQLHHATGRPACSPSSTGTGAAPAS